MDPENYRSAKYHVPKVAREKALKTCKTYTAYATALLPEFFKPSVTLFCTCTGSIKGKAADGNVRASLPKEALAVFLGETLLHFFHCSPLSRANLPLQTTAAVLAVSTLRSTCLLRVRSSVCFVQSICIFRLNERNSSSYPQRSRRNVTTAWSNNQIPMICNVLGVTFYIKRLLCQVIVDTIYFLFVENGILFIFTLNNIYNAFTSPMVM